MERLDLVALGEVALDLILAGVDKVPHRWSEVGRVRAAGVFAAGSAGYVAQCFSKLGGHAAIAGRIGNDTLGKVVIEGFREHGVSTRNLIVDSTVETEVSTVIVYNDGSKSSVLSQIPPLKLGTLSTACLKEARALHVGGYLLLPDLWGRDILRWIKSAGREGALVSLDPQMSVTGEWSKPFEGVLEHVDILLLDEAEAKNMSRKRRIEDAVEALLGRGCATVAVKAGKMGCIVGERGRILCTKPFKTRPISTIGPGDAFDAAFIYGALKRWTLEKVAEFSNVVAALSTTKLGCMTAVPKAKIAEKIMESYYR